MDEEQLDTIELIGARVTFVPMGEGTSYSLTEWDLEPGAQGPPIHIHHKTDEGFYVMAGHIGFVLDGMTTYGKPGTHVLVPMGHEHSFWNAGVRPAKCLCIISPPGLEQYFRELAAQLGDIKSQDDSIPVRKKLSEKYDMEVVGPIPSPAQAGAIRKSHP
ncbi:MAG TPA: cupin domain-containing protein [Candidatus Dormibacteraeota bacterium]|nr:cupin domain-containing protein [Candidatus Dormibacteraeota bacterium]